MSDELKKIEELEDLMGMFVTQLFEEMIKRKINKTSLPGALLSHSSRNAFRVMAYLNNDCQDPISALNYGEAFLRCIEGEKIELNKMLAKVKK